MLPYHGSVKIRLALILTGFIFTIGLIAPLVRTQAQTSQFALLAISPTSQKSVCVHQPESSLLTTLSDQGFRPKQDDTGFIYSLIGYDGPISSDPKAGQAFWGLWVKTADNQPVFSQLGPSLVTPATNTLYIFSFGNGQLPTIDQTVTSICQPPVEPATDPVTRPTVVSQPALTSPAAVAQLAADSPLQRATSYLQNNYADQGGANQDWAAIALGANNQHVSVGSLANSTSLSLARHILAKAAQGADRFSELQQLEAAYSDNQFGDRSLINDDIFSALAVKSTDPGWLDNHSEVFTTIAHSQRSDGSFGFSQAGNGDTDLTAAALWLLTNQSTIDRSVVDKASHYLDTSLNSDGGFGFQPNTPSNIASTSWALLAEHSLGKDTGKAERYLLGQQQLDGAWLQASQENFLNSAYATLALSGKTMPVTGNISQPATPNQTTVVSHPVRPSPRPVVTPASHSVSQSADYSSQVSVSGQNVLSQSIAQIDNCRAVASVSVTYDTNGRPVVVSTSTWICQ
jgi:hypothetical protein